MHSVEAVRLSGQNHILPKITLEKRQAWEPLDVSATTDASDKVARHD